MDSERRKRGALETDVDGYLPGTKFLLPGLYSPSQLAAPRRETLRSATGTHHSIVITNKPPVSHLAAVLIPVL